MKLALPDNIKSDSAPATRRVYYCDLVTLVGPRRQHACGNESSLATRVRLIKEWPTSHLPSSLQLCWWLYLKGYHYSLIPNIMGIRHLYQAVGGECGLPYDHTYDSALTQPPQTRQVQGWTQQHKMSTTMTRVSLSPHEDCAREFRAHLPDNVRLNFSSYSFSHMNSRTCQLPKSLIHEREAEIQENESGIHGLSEISCDLEAWNVGGPTRRQAICTLRVSQSIVAVALVVVWSSILWADLRRMKIVTSSLPRVLRAEHYHKFLGLSAGNVRFPRLFWTSRVHIYDSEQIS
ncbi:hypothetical protein BDR05DRAFT_991686, partial [Suillus weaverae]